jgi:hypothetical protein
VRYRTGKARIFDIVIQRPSVVDFAGLIVLGVERAVSSNGAKKRGNGVGVERDNWPAKESTGGGGGGEEASYDKRGSSHCLREKIVCLGLGKLEAGDVLYISHLGKYYLLG